MTLEQLCRAAKACLTRHPEWAKWELYNDFEQSWNIDVVLAPKNPDGRHPTIKITEEAKIDDWENQKWFYEDLGIEPSEDLKKDWERDDTRKRIVKYFQKMYPDDKVVDVCVENPSDIKVGDSIMTTHDLFDGMLELGPSILMRYVIKSEWAARNPNCMVYSGLATVVRKVVKQFMYGLASDTVLDTIMCRIRNELVELDYNTDQFYDFPGTGISDAVKSVKVVGLPVYEIGASGSVVVVTCEL